MTWTDLSARTRDELDAAGIAFPDTEARWMIEDVSGLSRAELLAEADTAAPTRAQDAVAAMVRRRASGEPLQYILGHWAFREFELLVDSRVLIPRPETEWVVELALDAMANAGFARGLRNGWTGTSTEYAVADLGTGSGAIAIALAAALPQAEVWATDASDDALRVARANVAGCGATRIRLTHGSWFTALPADLEGQLQLVVSNPPYISASEWESLDPEVRNYEPLTALVAGPDGFEAVSELIDTAFRWLAPGGILVIEMAPHQTERAESQARARGYGAVQVSYDLAGRTRALTATKPKEAP